MQTITITHWFKKTNVHQFNNLFHNQIFVETQWMMGSALEEALYEAIICHIFCYLDIIVSFSKGRSVTYVTYMIQNYRRILHCHCQLGALSWYLDFAFSYFVWIFNQWMPSIIFYFIWSPENILSERFLVKFNFSQRIKKKLRTYKQQTGHTFLNLGFEKGEQVLVMTMSFAFVFTFAIMNNGLNDKFFTWQVPTFIIGHMNRKLDSEEYNNTKHLTSRLCS